MKLWGYFIKTASFQPPAFQGLIIATWVGNKMHPHGAPLLLPPPRCGPSPASSEVRSVSVASPARKPQGATKAEQPKQSNSAGTSGSGSLQRQTPVPALQKVLHELQPWAAARAPSGLGSSHQLLPLEARETTGKYCVCAGRSIVYSPRRLSDNRHLSPISAGL